MPPIPLVSSCPIQKRFERGGKEELLHDAMRDLEGGSTSERAAQVDEAGRALDTDTLIVTPNKVVDRETRS